MDTCLDETPGNVCCGGTTSCPSANCISSRHVYYLANLKGLILTVIVAVLMSAGINALMAPETRAVEALQSVLLGRHVWQGSEFNFKIVCYILLINGSCTSIPPVQSATPTSTPNSPSPTPSPTPGGLSPSPTPSPTPGSPSPSPSPTTSPVASNPTPTPTPDPLSELNAGVPPSAKADPAAACFLSTQFSCYYTTPAWYTSLPSDAQSYYSSTNSVADHSAFCTSTAIINPQCNTPHPMPLFLLVQKVELA